MRLPPRVPLGQFPTPLEALPRLSAELGVEVLVKREDLTGLALGGNKIRKLEMLMAEAVANNADAVITCGSVQSNHCRCTAAAAAKLGLECGLVLFEGRHNEETGNLLLDRLFGARVEVHPLAETPRAAELMASLGRHYRRPHVIPYGGSNGLGAAAYFWGYQELVGQLGGPRGTIFCATSSGATHAGLALGEAVLAGPRVVGISIADPADSCLLRLVPMLEEAGNILGLEPGAVRPTVLDGHQGSGYGIPTPEGMAAIRRLAASDGLLLDPVYTAKAMAGLLAEHGKYEAPLVFLHSGGTPALFAYAEELSPGSLM